jgi:dienelactone hydrolase
MGRGTVSLMQRISLVAGVVVVYLGVVASSAGAAPSPLPTKTTTVTVSIDGRSFPARLVRPARRGTYPVVAFGHGFAQGSSRYASTLTAIAARGYVVIAPDSERGLLPDHARFADDLWRSLRWARANVAGASRTADAVAGHSMGGGAALLAADRYPAIDTVLTLAAAETRPSATAASAGISAPALYVVGSEDTIVPPATTRAMYAGKPPPATFASITGGFHCGFADSTSFGGIGCDSGSISRARQLALTQRLLGDRLDARFRGAREPAARAGVTVVRK